MEIRQQGWGLLRVLGSPKVLLGQIVAIVLFAIFASLLGPSGASTGADDQAASLWGQPLPFDLRLLSWALVASLSLSTILGLLGRLTTGVARSDRWALAGILACHLGLLIAILGCALGRSFGFRGQVLVPRSGTASAAKLLGGSEVDLPFILEHRQGDTGSAGDTPVSKSTDGTGRIVVREGKIEALPRGLRLYPAGEVRIGASGTLRVFDRSGRVLLDELGVREGDIVAVPASEAVVKVAGLWRSLNDLGPAARLVLSDPTRGTETFLVFRALPGWDRGRGDDLIFQMTSFAPGSEYLRFWVVKDPGLPIAVIGGLILFAGSLGGLAGWRRKVSPPTYTRHTAITVSTFRKTHLPPRELGGWGRTGPIAGSVMTPDVPRQGERCVQA